MKLNLNISFLLMTLFLSSCSQTSDSYVGSGTDQLPKSECSPCTKQVIYRDGQWL